MALVLTGGKAFNLTEIQDQYTLYSGDTSRGLLRTQELYQQIKDPSSGDYDFGELTERYFNLHGGQKRHWRQSIATFVDIHPVLKSVIMAALTHEPNPLEIQLNWDANAKPDPNSNKGVYVLYNSDNPKYFLLIFGYAMPA